MTSLKYKGSLKCECGVEVFQGSVFCPRCRAEINRKNAKVIKKEDNKYQKKMRNKRNQK